MSDDFSKEYSEAGFWEKLKGFAKTAGREVVELALRLWDEKSKKLIGFGPMRQRRREQRIEPKRDAVGS